MCKKILLLIAIIISFAFTAPAYSADYTYNSANQLISIDYGNGTVVNYTYDAAGNTISMSVTRTDSTPPTGSIAINNDAVSTNSTSVTLNLSATDDSGTVSQMRFSNDNVTWSDWEPYATTKAWTLSTGNGTKTVYVQFMDAAL